MERKVNQKLYLEWAKYKTKLLSVRLATRCRFLFSLHTQD